MADKYNVTCTSGGQLRSHLNRLSHDGHYSIAFFNNHITVFSVQSRSTVRSFPTIEDLEISDILDAHVSPVNGNLIYLLTKNKIFIINWYDNLKDPLVSTLELTSPSDDANVEYHRIINFSSNSEIVINLLTKNQMSYSIVSYDLQKNEIRETFKAYENISSFAFSNNRKNLLLVAANNGLQSVQLTLFTFDDNNESELTSYTIQYQAPNPHFVISSAISNSQTDPLIAIALSNGSIVLMFDLLNSSKPTQKLLKWHIEPVSALEFNHDTTYLISGGSEKVLVFWNILNDKQQFLPRLNGTIGDIKINYRVPTLISLTLNVIDNDSEYLVLGTTDLLSKLDINSPHLFAGLNNKDALKKKLARDQNMFTKNNKHYGRFKNNYKSMFRIHPVSSHMYLPAGRHLQIYDPLHNNQVDNIAVAPAVQQYGKVGNETKISDPIVVGFDFVSSAKTNNKDWLVTCDMEIRGEAEELTNTSIECWETLKFWKQKPNASSKNDLSASDSWALQTKILRPHGKFLITDIIPAPLSYFGGEAVLTADSCGNVRLWRPNSQGIWSLRKFYSSGSEFSQDLNLLKKNELMNNIANNEGTALSWSPDSSLIAVGRNGKVILLDINTFEAIHTIEPSITSTRFHSHASIDDHDDDSLDMKKVRYIDINLQDSHIISINFTSNGKLLLIETKTHIVVLDILRNRVVFGLLLSNENGSFGYGGSFIKLVSRSRDVEGTDDLDDNTTDELLVVGKHFNSNGEIISKVSLWNISDKKSTITCKWCTNYDGSIIGAEWSPSWSKWIIADSESNLGEITFGKSNTRISILQETAKKSEENWIVSHLLDNARVMNRAIAKKTQIGDSDEFNDRVGLQADVFDKILDDIDGLTVNSIFERVLKVV